MLLTALLLALASPLAAQFQSADPAETFVPWKIANPDDPPVDADLVLDWLPASRDELRHSPLLTSRALAQLETRCVAMQVIRPDDDASIAKLHRESTRPAAVLVEAQGAIVAQVEKEGDVLNVAKVEKMVRDALDAREAEVDRLLDRARSEVEAGRKQSAAELYRKVAARRCTAPRKKRDAERALHKLGAAEKGE